MLQFRWRKLGKCFLLFRFFLILPMGFLVFYLILEFTSAFGAPETSPGSLLATGLLVSPRHPEPGDLLRILASADEPLDGSVVSVKGPSGEAEAREVRRGGGPPFWMAAVIRVESAGSYLVSLKRKDRILASIEFQVQARKPGLRDLPVVWSSERGWGRAEENLYSAWIDALFREADERSSWKALHVVLRDSRRNLLFNSLGLGEDDPAGKSGLDMEPDCADNPYFFRAYFAWKLGLPFGFRTCSRGSLGRAPECGHWLTNESLPGRGGPARSFHRFLAAVMNAIHSGSARTRLEAEDSDYYPLPLTRRDLRPGAVYADPYGHTLVVVRWVPQKDKTPGALLSVDAQPDGTIGVKRFWKGNFLFVTREVIGEAGFKAFRPIVRDGGKARPLTNAEIAASPEYGNFSLQQKDMEPADFYRTMEGLINPEPLDPVSAFRDLFEALQEQLIVRVESVANGEDYMRAHPGTVIPMPPSGAGVFQAMGLWEDYSTPNRDLRLLIALDTLLEFPDKVAASPQSYKAAAKASPEKIKEDLLALQKKWAAEMTITYTRSDGYPQTLTLEDIIKRKEALEIGYNPNDGVEIRWGAPEGSPERATCRRRAPASQVQKMEALRTWFRKRLHPPT